MVDAEAETTFAPAIWWRLLHKSAHVRAVRLKRQPGRQVHQVGAAHVQHRRDQQRQLRPLTLLRQATLEFRTEALRDFLDAVHHVVPGSAKGGTLEPHTNSSRQQPSLKTDRWQGGLLPGDDATGELE